jgi:hypothetical protein
MSTVETASAMRFFFTGNLVVVFLARPTPAQHQALRSESGSDILGDNAALADAT